MWLPTCKESIEVDISSSTRNHVMNEANHELQRIAGTLSQSTYPKKLAIELCADCNLNCAMCHHDQMARPKGVMPLPLFQRMIDELAPVKPDCEIWVSFLLRSRRRLARGASSPQPRQDGAGHRHPSRRALPVPDPRLICGVHRQRPGRVTSDHSADSKLPSKGRAEA